MVPRWSYEEKFEYVTGVDSNLCLFFMRLVRYQPVITKFGIMDLCSAERMHTVA